METKRNLSAVIFAVGRLSFNYFHLANGRIYCAIICNKVGDGAGVNYKVVTDAATIMWVKLQNKIKREFRGTWKLFQQQQRCTLVWTYFVMQYGDCVVIVGVDFPRLFFMQIQVYVYFLTPDYAFFHTFP